MTVFFHTGAHAGGPPRSVSGRAALWTLSSDTTEMIAAATVAVRRLWVPGFRYAKAGVMLDDLVPAGSATGDLLAKADPRREQLMAALDRVTRRHGRGALEPARAGLTNRWSTTADMRSQAYTTRPSETPLARG